jgi:hypothetical protein
MSIGLDATLALTAKLKVAEKRALVAETALEIVRRQMEAETPGMVVIVGKIDLKAAEEALRKAEEADELRKMYEAEVKWRKSYQDGKGELYSKGGVIAEAAMECLPCNEAGVDQFFRKNYVHADAYATLRAERDELAALVEQLSARLRSTLENCAISQFGSDYYAKTDELLNTTPPAALAALRQRVRAEVLEEAATHLRNCEMSPDAIAELWRMEPWFAEIIRSYAYDKHFAPGGRTETYYRDKAQSKGLRIVSKEYAQEVINDESK